MDFTPNYILTAIRLLEKAVAKRGGSLPADALTRAYALLVLTTGTGTTLENVHDAWAMWRAFSDRPDHKDIVWFSSLAPSTVDWDLPYRDAIREAAADLEAMRESADPASADFLQR